MRIGNDAVLHRWDANMHERMHLGVLHTDNRHGIGPRGNSDPWLERIERLQPVAFRDRRDLLYGPHGGDRERLRQLCDRHPVRNAEHWKRIHLGRHR